MEPAPTARRPTEAIVRLATHDSLTGLANRHRFTRQLAEALERSDPADEVWVALLDLDGFKAVNDTHGHPVGDLLLESVAGRLVGRLGGTGSAARLGGDEFALVLTAPQGSADAVEAELRTILDALCAPYGIGPTLLRIGCSAGLAVAPGDASGVSDLLSSADLALYAAKRAGGSTVVRCDPALRARAADRSALWQDLARAVPDRQLRVAYQPIVEVATGRITSVEALARWHHPTHGVQVPAAFVPAAEEAGLIDVLGLEVLRLACADLVALPEAVSIAVNVSPLQLRDRDVASRFASVLAAADADPTRIVVEITETALVDDEARARLVRIRALGVRVAIDDFGTGYSSFAALGSLPLDTLKIDRSFIGALGRAGEDGRAQAVVSAMVQVARAFELTTTAEGVETTEELALVSALGCTHHQGHLVAAPLPVEDLVALLDGHPGRPQATPGARRWDTW